MKSFRTELQVKPSPHKIDHCNSVLTIGSCFSDTIGGRLISNKFNAVANPFGALYNPLSIHQALLYALHNELPQAGKYIHHQGIWSNFDFHSSFSGSNKMEVESKINNAIGASHHFLKDAGTLIITYGTAKVFEHILNGETVANCHKTPATNFTTELMSPEKIKDSFCKFFEQLHQWNPGLKIILTISPVRHIKDSIEVNSISKSSLRWACHEIIKEHPAIDYFPAYEIMMDDLRDYRFYDKDMLHPSDTAIDYLWQRFSEVYFSSSTIALMKQWQEVERSLLHRPFHPGSATHNDFLREILRKLEELKSRIHVDEEIVHIKSQLTGAV